MVPAASVVAAIRAAGGSAVMNGDNIADWHRAKRRVDHAVGEFGRLDVLVNNAGILRDRMLVNMTEANEMGSSPCHLKGSFAATRHAAAYWRDRSKATGAPVDARIINTPRAPAFSAIPGKRQSWDCGAHHHRRARAQSLWHHRQCRMRRPA